MAAAEIEDYSRRTGGPGALRKAEAQMRMTQPLVGASVPLRLYWKLQGGGKKERPSLRRDRKSELTTRPGQGAQVSFIR